MAISPAVYSATEYRVAFAEQIAWGTANTTQADFFEIYTTELVLPDFSGILSDETKRSNGKKVLDATDVFRSNAGSEYTVTVSGVLTNKQLGKLLYGVTQYISAEVDTTPYLKTFTIDGTTVGNSVTPSMFFTMLFYNPATSEHIALKDCVVKALTITCDPGASGGRATFSATFVTGGLPSFGATATPASWTAPGVTFYLGQTLATKTLASADLVLGKYELTIDNGATRVGFQSDGEAEGMSMQMLDVSGSIEVKYDAFTKDLVDKWLASPTAGSADSDLILVHSANTETDYLSITLHTIPTAQPALAGSEKGVFSTYAFRAVTESSTAAATLVIGDGLDEGWIGA